MTFMSMKAAFRSCDFILLHTAASVEVLPQLIGPVKTKVSRVSAVNLEMIVSTGAHLRSMYLVGGREVRQLKASFSVEPYLALFGEGTKSDERKNRGATMNSPYYLMSLIKG